MQLDYEYSINILNDFVFLYGESFIVILRNNLSIF